MSTETIKAISGLWPLVLSITLLIALILFFVFRKSLPNFLNRMKTARFERGDSKFELEMDSSSTEEANTPAPQAPQEETEDKKEDRPDSGTTPGGTTQSPTPLVWQWLDAESNRDYELADSLYAQVESEEKDPVELQKLPILKLRIRADHGDANSLQKLLEMHKADPTSTYIAYSLGLCFSFADNHRKAVEYFNLALNHARNDDEKANCICEISRSMKERSHKERIQYLLSKLRTISSEKSRAMIFKEIADVFKDAGDETMRALFLQKYVQLIPNDSSAYFNAAYSLFNVGVYSLSYENYVSSIAFSGNNSTAKNNLGVVEDRLDMEISSVKHYREGFDEGSTLAGANLAYKLMAQGFRKEALELLEGAKRRRMCMKMFIKQKSVFEKDWKRSRRKGVVYDL